MLAKSFVFHCHFMIYSSLPQSNKLTKRAAVSQSYTGHTLKRLLEQRWTGHLATLSVIINCYTELIEGLKECSESSSVAGDIKVQATGYLRHISSVQFRCLAQIMHRILSTLQPANAMLQVSDELLTV